jgi:hypothetical protein
MFFEKSVVDETNLPYFSSELGVLCRTRVTIEGVTREMWLPVMSNANKAMKLTAYKNRGKIIEPATMTDGYIIITSVQASDQLRYDSFFPPTCNSLMFFEKSVVDKISKTLLSLCTTFSFFVFPIVLFLLLLSLYPSTVYDF